MIYNSIQFYMILYSSVIYVNSFLSFLPIFNYTSALFSNLITFYHPQFLYVCSMFQVLENLFLRILSLLSDLSHNPPYKGNSGFLICLNVLLPHLQPYSKLYYWILLPRKSFCKFGVKGSSFNLSTPLVLILHADRHNSLS